MKTNKSIFQAEHFITRFLTFWKSRKRKSHEKKRKVELSQRERVINNVCERVRRNLVPEPTRKNIKYTYFVHEPGKLCGNVSRFVITSMLKNLSNPSLL